MKNYIIAIVSLISICAAVMIPASAFAQGAQAFPDVRVQFAHYCSSIYNGINLEQCSEFFGT